MRYNRECEEVERLSAQGRAFVLWPSRPVTVKRVESDVEKLGDLYWEGYQDALDCLEDLRRYLG